jgi:hypothetical protein
VDLTTQLVKGDLDLRPGVNNPLLAGVPGGEFPFWISVKGNSTAYISSARDREVVVVNLSGSAPKITDRINVKGKGSLVFVYITVDDFPEAHVQSTSYIAPIHYTVLVHRQGRAVVLEPAHEWPDGYIESFAGFPEDFTRPPQGEVEERTSLR